MSKAESWKSIMVTWAWFFGLSYLAAGIITPYIWKPYPDIMHTIMELACCLIAFYTFLVVWHSPAEPTTGNKIIAYGFLVVTLFELFHIFYYPPLNHYPDAIYDLGTRYGLMGRAVEALALFMVTIPLVKLKTNKWLNLVIALGLVGLLAWSVQVPDIIPALVRPDGGVTVIKMVLETGIILILLAALFRISPMINRRELISYRYLALALLLAIPAEVCLGLYNSVISFSLVWGHFLRLACFYFIYIGIVVASFKYPYRELEKTNRNLYSIMQSLPLGVLAYDGNHNLTFANTEALSILKSPLNKLQDYNDHEMAAMLFGINQEVNQTIPEVITGNALTGEDLVLHMNVVSLADNERLYLFGDVSKEQEFNTLRLQTQTILNAINNLVVLCDADYKVMAVNRAFSEITGFSPRVQTGIYLFELTNNIGLQVNRGAMQYEMAKEYNIVTSEGQSRQVLASLNRVLDIQGRLVGYIGIASDITELKRSHQLLQQQEKLSVLGEMAAGIVHEIRNPLTIIQGFNDLLIAGERSKEEVHYLQAIKEAIKDINLVVSDFLDFARPRPPQLGLHSLNRLAQQSVMLLGGNTSPDGIEIELVTSDQDLAVLIDDGQIKQVILNLARNALDALVGIAEPRLTIRVSYDQTRQKMLVLVEDNGKGMHEDLQRLIGTPFFTTKDNGTGLGLSICYQLMKENNGELSFISKPGQGTRFQLAFPLADKT